jgi:hypothetical protein
VLLELSSEEKLVQLQALVSAAISELEVNSPEHCQAFKARLRDRILRVAGPRELAAFEQWYGVSLGEWSGTRELAHAFGKPEGTMANLAHRGEQRLVKIVRRWLEAREEGRGVSTL